MTPLARLDALLVRGARGWLGRHCVVDHRAIPSGATGAEEWIAVRTPIATIRAALGSPAREGGSELAYPVASFPGHLFRFSSRDGVLIESGLVRRERSVLPARGSRDWEAWGRELATLGASAGEVEGVLGAPIETIGWWPIEEHRHAHGSIETCLSIVIAAHAPRG